MRTTISISDPLLKNAKHYAESHGVTLSAVIEDALRIHLNRTSAQKPSKFRLHTVRGRIVDPALNLDRTSELLVNEDETAYRGLR
jgi:hypothetical protein